MDITPFLRREKFWNKFRKPDSADKDPITTRALLQYLEANRDEVLSHKERVSFIKVANPRLIAFLWKAMREASRGKRNATRARTRAIAAVFMAGAGTLFGVAPSAEYIATVRKLMERYLGDSKDLELVEKAVPHSVTTNMGMELMQLAERCDTTNRKAMADFARNSRAAEEAIDRICRRFGDAGKPRVAKKAHKLLHDFREMFGVREQSKFVITQGLQMVRNSLHDC